MVYRRLAQAVLFSLIGVLAGPAMAGTETPVVTYRSLQTRDGSHSFRLLRQINSHGEVELTVFHEELRVFLPTLEVPVLYARDTDGDRKLDAWFIPTGPATIEATVRPAQENDGWDVASGILQNDIGISNRPFLGLMLQAVQENLTLNGAQAFEFFRQLTRTSMDLHDLDIRADRLRGQNPKAAGLADLYATVGEGWRELDHEISERGIQAHIIATFSDILLAGTVGVVAEGAQVAVAWIGPRLAESAVGAAAVEAYQKFVVGFGANAKRMIRATRLKSIEKTASAVAEASARVAFAKLTLSQRLSTQIEGLEARGSVAKLAARALKRTGQIVASGLREWRYVTQTQATQLVAEAFSRKDTLFDPNPIVVAKNIAGDRDLMQNLSYMTAETFLQTGVSASDPNLKRRMFLCGVLSFTDSAGMNLLVKKQVDPARNVLDTGWEVVIGNAQTQFDVSMLGYFEKVAMRKGNPRWKLLGYGIALVDQLAGYFAYSKVTQRFETVTKSGQPAKSASLPPKVVLVPIVSEQTQGST